MENKGFDILSSFLYFGIGLLMTLLLYRYLIPKVEKGAIRKLGGFPIFTAWTFFIKRYDFIWENFGNNPSPHFKFNVLHVGLFLSIIGPGLTTTDDLCSIVLLLYVARRLGRHTLTIRN
jgi:hypothetical protein